MNWLIDTGVMEQKRDSLGDKGRFWLRREDLSQKGWKNHIYCNYFSSKKVREASRRKLLFLWVVGWLLGSLCIFWFMYSHAFEKRKETLASMCDERARVLQDQFNVSMNHLQALSILIATLHHANQPSVIDQMTFAKYAERTAFQRPLTSGVAYAVKVLHSEREEFERQQGWTIKVMYSEKQQSPAYEGDSLNEAQETSPIHEEYAPVIFAQDAYKHVISLDMLSGKEDLENILRARSSGKGVLTSPFRLVKSNRLGVILTYAVYRKELPLDTTSTERIQAAIGYLGGIFDVEALVDKLLHQLACKESIMVNVYDTTDAVEPISMYGANIVSKGIVHISALNFGDPMRKHEMHCRFKQNPPLPSLAITTSIGVLIIALLIGYDFHATVNRLVEVEDDYRQMMELKKRAEAAEVAKSQFLATVSHEIRTPMNGFLGMLQMLMDTDLDITQQDYARIAQDSGKVLVSLINEVLDRAKLESGKLELEAAPFDLRAVLDDVLSLFYCKSQEKGIELAVYVSDQVPETLIGDSGRVRQIITNLMGNSIKFTDNGHIFLTVHLVEEVMTSTLEEEKEPFSFYSLSDNRVVDKRQSWANFNIFNQGLSGFRKLRTSSTDLINLIISVEDTGVGIPHEAQSRVFAPFMQVGPSISRIHGGTGIGLSITKCLVNLMMGEIGFVSEPQVGSTFTFTAILSRAYVESKEYKPSEFQGMTSLIVDHRTTRAKVTRYHLLRLGIQSELAMNLDEVIPRATKGALSVDMVLVDKESWSRNAELWPLFLNKMSNEKNVNAPKIVLLANSCNTARTGPTISMEYVSTVVMKPLRASMLLVSLQRVMGSRGKDDLQSGRLPGLSLSSLLHGRQILVVDDNIVNLRVAAGALKKYGAEVICADSGKKAVMMLKPPHKFDACFMDIHMPEMNGFEATRRIRQMEADINDHIKHGEASLEDCGNILHWHIPILAMTADVIEATKDLCLKSGMDGYVSKPFEGEQLYREVVRFFKSTTKMIE